MPHRTDRRFDEYQDPSNGGDCLGLHLILSPRADTRLAGVLLEACSQVYKFLIEGDL